MTNARRTLFIVPVVHSTAELGSLAPAASTPEARRRAAVVDAFWVATRRRLGSLTDTAAGLRLFQDGLPVCGRELDIVRDLARQGSANHRLLCELIDAGAVLVGTEDGALLVQEYEVHRALAADPARGTGLESRLAELLVARDQFMARQIANTLPLGGRGLLFVGALHRVEAYLPDDIHIEWPVTRIRRAAKES